MSVAVRKHIVEVSSRDLIPNVSYDQWFELDLCEGALCKRIKTPEDYNGFLLRYKKGLSIPKHRNNDEYHILQVKDGVVLDLVTNDVYTKGDTIVFDKGQEHELTCIEEAYVFCMMTDNYEVVKKLTQI
jgi:quercetin dioxygenase-like cupin family protein